MSDGGVNDTDTEPYHCDGALGFTTISGVSFILTFIFSIIGNILLICVVIIYEKLKNSTNLFVLNLACSDLVFTLTLPFWAVYFLHDWVFGEFVCKFVTAAYFIGQYSSVILLTAMTVDRFITVVLHNWPSNSVRRQRCAVAACVAAWIISSAASVSDVIKVKVETWGSSTSCGPPSDEPESYLDYYIQVSLLFFLPFAIIVFCYSAILKTVLQASNRRRYRTVVVVLCIVLAFFICWGPYNILLLIQSLYKTTDCNVMKNIHIADSVSRILAFSHCCMNPLLYMLSQKLRKHLLHFVNCSNTKNKNREKTGQSTSIIPNVAFTAQNSAVLLEMPVK